MSSESDPIKQFTAHPSLAILENSRILILFCTSYLEMRNIEFLGPSPSRLLILPPTLALACIRVAH